MFKKNGKGNKKSGLTGKKIFVEAGVANANRKMQNIKNISWFYIFSQIIRFK